MARRHALLLALAACTACSRQPPVAGPPETRAERLAVIDRIATECQVPRAMMELAGDDQLQLRPGSDLAYERVECVLRRIDGLNLPAGHVTFVGVPAPAARPEGNAAQASETANVAAAEASNAQTD